MNGPAPGRLSRRGGTGCKPGSLCRGLVGGTGSQGFRRPSPGLVGPAAGAHRPLRTPQGGRFPPLGSPPTPGTEPNPQPGSNARSKVQRLGELQPPLSPLQGGGGRCRVAQGDPADKSPRRNWRLPGAAGGNRRRAPRAGAPRSRARGARARPLPLGARRCPLQSLQQHSPMAAARARRSAPLPGAPPAARTPGAARPTSGRRAVCSPARGHRPGSSLALTLRTGPAPRVSRPPGRPC